MAPIKRGLIGNILNDLRESLSLRKHIPAYFTPNQSTGKWMAENPEINKTLEGYAKHRMQSSDPGRTADKLHSYLKGEKPPTKEFQDAANELINDHKPMFQKELNAKLRAGLRGSAYTSAVTTPATYYGYQYYKSKYPKAEPTEQPEEQKKIATYSQEFIEGFLKHAEEKGIDPEHVHWVLNQSDRTPFSSNLQAMTPDPFLGASGSIIRANKRREVLKTMRNKKEEDLWLKTHPYGHPGLAQVVGMIGGGVAGGAAGSRLLGKPITRILNRALGYLARHGEKIPNTITPESLIQEGKRYGASLGTIPGAAVGGHVAYNIDEQHRLNKVKQLTNAEKAKY